MSSAVHRTPVVTARIEPTPTTAPPVPDQVWLATRGTDPGAWVCADEKAARAVAEGQWNENEYSGASGGGEAALDRGRVSAR